MTAEELAEALGIGQDEAEALLDDLQEEYDRELRAAAERVIDTLPDEQGWAPPPESILYAAAAAITVAAILDLRTRVAEAVAAPILALETLDPAPIVESLGEALVVNGDIVTRGLGEAAAEEIINAFEQRLTIPETAARLRALTDEIVPWQANMLARTDLVAVSNAASVVSVSEANRAAALAGRPTVPFKQWLTVGDERVRHDHRVANGQTVPVGQPFTVAGIAMQYPGDPAGGPTQTWNCRCGLIFTDTLTAASPPAALPSPQEEPMSTYQIPPFTANTTTGVPADGWQVWWPTVYSSGTDTTAVAADSPAPMEWETDPGIAYEGISTEDGRFLVLGSTDWRELPLTLLAQTALSDGHDGAQVAGRIDILHRQDNDGERATIYAAGIFDDSTFGRDIARMVDQKILRGVSVDLAVLDWTFRDPDSGEILDVNDMSEDDWMRAFFGELDFAVLSSQILGATIVPFPAFAQARVQTVTADGGEKQMRLTLNLPLAVKPRRDENLVAAAKAPIAPPREWFETPEPDKLTPMTITAEGRVYGHAATWNCHESFRDHCVVAPRSQSNLAYFHVGEIETAEGDLIPVGRWTVGGPHAAINLGRAAAQRHYDDASTVGAFVRASEGRHGVWVCGALKSDATAEQVRDMRANPPSGDWRGGELILVHSVPVPGLPVPRTQARVLVASNGEPEVTALISAAVQECEECAEMTAEEYLIRVEALSELAGLDDAA